jgi:hypothetical protein
MMLEEEIDNKNFESFYGDNIILEEVKEEYLQANIE